MRRIRRDRERERVTCHRRPRARRTLTLPRAVTPPPPPPLPRRPATRGGGGVPFSAGPEVEGREADDEEDDGVGSLAARARRAEASPSRVRKK